MNIKYLNQTLSKKICTFMVIIILIITMQNFILTVAADDFIVDDDGTGDYTSIQDAIDNVPSGSTIWVKDGSYAEQLTINKPLKILAVNNEKPHLYVTSDSPGITISANNVTFEGFKIFGNSDIGGGPTILASTGSDYFSIRSNEFTVISGEYGNTVLDIRQNVRNGEFYSNYLSNYETGLVFDIQTDSYVYSNTYQNVNNSVIHATELIGSNRFYGTIQDAINDASVNATISTSLGTFYENLIINKPITLKGNNFGITPSADGTRSHDESTIVGAIQSAILISSDTSYVTIDGFTITISSKSSTSNEAGILIGKNTRHITISNNIIHNITDGVGPDSINDETYGIMIYGRDATGGQSDILINDNYIDNVEEYGIAINDKTLNVAISDNVINNLTGSNHNADPFWNSSWPTLISSCIHLGGQVGPISDVMISGNVLRSNNTGDGSTSFAGTGISLAGISDWTNMSNVWKGFLNISIEDNVINDNSMGIIALAGNTSINKSIEVHDNNISENVLYGVNNSDSNISLNATNNWWGDMFGPYDPVDNPVGIGDAIFGDNIAYWPWYEFDGYSYKPIVEYTVGYPNASAGYYISDETEIQINAFDNETGMMQLLYRVWDTVNKWSEWMNYTDEISISNNGRHKIEYKAIDKAGSIRQAVNTHYVDSVDPIVHLISPNGDQSIFGQTTIEWEAYDRIDDQMQMQRNDSIALTEDYPGHIQSFIPTEASIDSVQLLLYGDDANITIRLFDELAPVPNLIAQTSKRVKDVGNPTSPVWVEFSFDNKIFVDDTETYYIGVSQKVFGNVGFRWFLLNHSNASTDPYPSGHAWLKGFDTLESKPDWDWCFKTTRWNTNLDITLQYSTTGVAPWTPIVEQLSNDGSYVWNTNQAPDGEDYKVRVIAIDLLEHMGADSSDETFVLDNTGPIISDITITDNTIGSDEFVSDGHNITISATILNNPVTIYADLSSFGSGTNVSPDSFSGNTAVWNINSIVCSPSNGDNDITVTAWDSTGDSSYANTVITADNSNPVINITRPKPGLYFLDSMRLLPFSYPFIIGQITFEVETFDALSGISSVEFYIEDDLEETDSEPPYKMLWDRSSIGFFEIQIKAYDNVGLASSDVIEDLFIINLDIIGHG